MDKKINFENIVIWSALNNAQNMGMKFLIQYESGMINKTPEITEWYEETKKEFNILQKAKEELEK